jgi:SAM-dependent methyltransferase
MRAGNDEVPSSESDGWSDQARAERYDRDVNRRFYRAILGELLERAPELRGQGLDLGCGTGFSTEMLAARLPGVTWRAADCSAAMLARARRKPSLRQVEWCQARAEALPMPDGSLDVVVANFSWHWFGEGAGREIRRVLRSGGWLLASVPLRRRSMARGNRALARALLARRRGYSPRPTQGLRFAEVPDLLPGPVTVARHQVAIERERFADGDELLDVLSSRGALAAIFGDRAPASIDVAGPVDFEWPFAVLHARVR